MQQRVHPVFQRLLAAPPPRPIVVAHRGDSRHHPENTLAAFRAARTLGVAMQEFDVQMLDDGTLVCMHDASFDRTTDACRTLGPGALLAHTTLQVARQLDAGAWFDATHAGERIPTLAEALATMLPACVPMIEHKAGPALAFVAELRRLDALEQCIVQSFDWAFVGQVAAAAPTIALAVLGPNAAHPKPDARAVDAAIASGARMLHWHATELTASDVERVHAAGMLVCTYTTDDELGWHGGRALGIDAMCTNDPARMRSALAAGPT